MKQGKELVETTNPKADSRNLCKAYLSFTYISPVSGYVISHWVDEHTHQMIDPDKRRYMKQNRKISPVQEDVIDLLLDSGQSRRSAYQYLINSHGGQENVGFLRSDMKNMLNKKREINMVHGEATVLHRWFRTQAQQNPGFF